MISKFHRWKIIEKGINDLYIDSNPHMSLIALHNDIKYPFKESFSIRFSNPDEFSQKTSSILSKEVARSVKSDAINCYLIGTKDEFYWPDDGFDPQEQYLNPVAIGRLTAKCNWGLGYPEIRSIFESPLIKEKKSVYGRFLTLEEMIFATERKLRRDTLKCLIDISLKDIPRRLDELSYNLYEETKIVEAPEEPEDNSDIQEDHVFSYKDLLEEGIPKFWRVCNGEKFTYEDLRVELLISDLLTIKFNITFTFNNTASTRERMDEAVDEFKQKSKLHLRLWTSSGLESFYEPNEELYEDNLSAMAGFFDEEGW